MSVWALQLGGKIFPLLHAPQSMHHAALLVPPWEHLSNAFLRIPTALTSASPQSLPWIIATLVSPTTGPVSALPSDLNVASPGLRHSPKPSSWHSKHPHAGLPECPASLFFLSPTLTALPSLSSALESPPPRSPRVFSWQTPQLRLLISFPLLGQLSGRTPAEKPGMVILTRPATRREHSGAHAPRSPRSQVLTIKP